MAKTPEEAAPTDDQKSQPAATFRHRTISASVFENQGQQGRTYYSVSVQKRFKPEGGEWQTSNSFMRDELPVLQELVRQAYAFILEQENKAPSDG